MGDYNFPKGLYVRVEEVKGEGIRADIYRRVEKEEGDVIHMKRVGLVWLSGDEKSLEGLAKRLSREEAWDGRS